MFPNVKEYSMGDNNLVAVFFGELRINVSKDVWNKEYEEPKEERINFAERIELVNNAVEKTTAKWKQAIEDIKAEIEKITPKVVHDHNEMEIYNVRKYDIDIIDKHTKGLMK